jgi:hypothetical protein
MCSSSGQSEETEVLQIMMIVMIGGYAMVYASRKFSGNWSLCLVGKARVSHMYHTRPVRWTTLFAMALTL